MTQPARILIVDDEENLLITLQEILRREGYEVCTAATSVEVSRLIEEEEFDVAILDLRLIGMDGIEVLHALRTEQPDCAAIMLTGYASLSSAVAAMREGAFDYLVKPCDVEELKLSVARAMKYSAAPKRLRERLTQLETAYEKLSNLANELQQQLEPGTAENGQKARNGAGIKRRGKEVHQRRAGTG